MRLIVFLMYSRELSGVSDSRVKQTFQVTIWLGDCLKISNSSTTQISRCAETYNQLQVINHIEWYFVLWSSAKTKLLNLSAHFQAKLGLKRDSISSAVLKWMRQRFIHKIFHKILLTYIFLTVQYFVRTYILVVHTKKT